MISAGLGRREGVGGSSYPPWDHDCSIIFFKSTNNALLNTRPAQQALKAFRAHAIPLFERVCECVCVRERERVWNVFFIYIFIN